AATDRATPRSRRTRFPLARSSLLGLLRRVGRGVAVEAGDRAGHQLRPDIVRMTLRLQELLRFAVAAQAPDVWIRVPDLDRMRPGPQDVGGEVADAVELGRDSAEHAVIAVARVALILPDVTVLVVDRRQGLALQVPEIQDVTRHGMAAAA